MEKSKGEVIVYKSPSGKIGIKVKLKQETVWLSLSEIAKLFNRDKTVILRHLRNIFKTKELEEKRNVQKMHIPFSDKLVAFYSLDAIISVGYRVNSARATRFRIWATDILRKHLIDGYTVNERRLREQSDKLEALQRAIAMIGDIKAKVALDHTEALGLLAVINDYNCALNLLDDYDRKKIKIADTSKEEKFRFTYEDAKKAVMQMKNRLGYPDLFGKEKDDSFKSSIGAIYQTFGEKDLYPSVEEKAANLLYFIIKNHSFIDGNKRIAASMFLWFLDGNELLYKSNGTKRLADNALVALTLMIAESKPDDRDLITTLVVRLINMG
ncbi:MAG: virulence protein RhuM/Fic/DOC family protein [Candidatus Omnitrophica bacterium]|nr:virulence protein RhuM/Fic/DOC family protein [Candidatus Omnitrophota bacterium]